MDDTEFLTGSPDYLSIGSMLKATPVLESGQRLIYLEASNESLDQQNEVVLQKALKDSADWFLRYGNLDTDHITMLGKPNPAKGHPGIPDSQYYEIGRPLEVRSGSACLDRILHFLSVALQFIAYAAFGSTGRLSQ
jgi:hypothetical protein